MVRLSRVLTVVTFISAIGTCPPFRAGTPEDQINRRMRSQIRGDIKAHGHTFEGPGNVPPALMKAIEGKRLIGLGEGTHGTSEIHTIQGNIILAMAKKGRVLVFLEDQFGAVEQINQFIQGIGEDADLASKMKDLFGVHNTQELGTFFREARKFNAALPAGAKIEIYGVDMQLKSGRNDLTRDLQEFCSANNLNLKPQIEACGRYIQDSRTQSPDSRATFIADATRIQLAIAGIAEGVPGKAEASVMANDLVYFILQDVAYNNVFANVIVDLVESTPATVYAQGIRDSAMAENIKILMEAKLPNSGVGVYWAHNAHMGRISYLEGDPSGFPSTWGSTGSILNAWLGDSYFPLAAITGKGTFRSRPLDKTGAVLPFQSILAPRIPPDCLNAIASSACPKPVFFQTSDVTLLGISRPEFSAGSPYEVEHPEHAFVRTVPGMAYGGVISFPVSTAAKEMN